MLMALVNCLREKVKPVYNGSGHQEELNTSERISYTNPYDTKMQNILRIYVEWNSEQRYFNSENEFADATSNFFRIRMQHYRIPVIVVWC